ncbi:MAG TPA: proton-conducting transporter membrane subunit [Acetobacteraceae bacterium]|nr:proton-conducting transporter membrane subunit [Acetobacteraceae bacterium]
MNGPVLTLLTAIMAALAGLGVLGVAWPQRGRRSIGYAAAGLAGLGALLAMVALLLNDTPATLALPLGPPGATFRLTLDPLAAFFAVLVFAAGAAIGAFAAATDAPPVAPDVPPGTLALLPACLAGLGLAVLAGDNLARGTGIALAGSAIWAMRTTDHTAGGTTDHTAAASTDRAAGAQLGVTLLAAAAVIAAAGAAPPVVLLAALLGPGALAGMVPLHAWLTPGHNATAPAAAALLSGAVVPVATYAMLRLLLDPIGAAPPGWWGLPLLMLGTASVAVGGLSATRCAELDTALAAGTVRQTGLTAIGLGIALTARASDLPAATAMALGAVLLLAALQATCGTLLPLVAGAIRQGAGTRRLDRLGGLVHRMPITTACLLAGLFGVAALPPGAGFAATWLLFQALLALPRGGGLPSQLLLCALAAVLGLAAALASSGLLRLVGVVCLGRPRTPRAAAADEPSRRARRPLLALATAATVLGVFVGPLLRLLADAPIRALTGTGLEARASLLGLATGAESPGYAALPLASLLVLAAGMVLWLRRLRRVPSGTVGGPAWVDGFAAPPAWLPFGNPATQSAGGGFTPLVMRAKAGPCAVPECLIGRRIRAFAGMTSGATALPRGPVLPRRRPVLPPLRAPAVALIVVAAMLALSAWAGTR